MSLVTMPSLSDDMDELMTPDVDARDRAIPDGLRDLADSLRLVGDVNGHLVRRTRLQAARPRWRAIGRRMLAPQPAEPVGPRCLLCLRQCRLPVLAPDVPGRGDRIPVRLLHLLGRRLRAGGSLRVCADGEPPHRAWPTR